MVGGAPPRDPAKYDGDQNTDRVPVRLIRPVCSARRCRELTPLGELTSLDRAISGGPVHEQVDVIAFTVELVQLGAEALAHVPHERLAAPRHLTVEDLTPVLRDEHQVGVQVVDCVIFPFHMRI
jgi:hypothetical protein